MKEVTVTSDAPLTVDLVLELLEIAKKADVRVCFEWKHPAMSPTAPRGFTLGPDAAKGYTDQVFAQRILWGILRPHGIPVDDKLSADFIRQMEAEHNFGGM